MSIKLSLSQNPSVFVINTGVPHAIDWSVTLWPEGWSEFLSGIIVKNEPEEIKKGIYQFLSMSKSEREKMGEKGREYVKAFSYERLSKKYIQLFDSL